MIGKYTIHMEAYGFPLFCFVANQPLFPKKNVPPSQIRKGFIASLVKGNQWFIRFKTPPNFPKDFQVVFRFLPPKKSWFLRGCLYIFLLRGKKKDRHRKCWVSQGFLGGLLHYEKILWSRMKSMKSNQKWSRQTKNEAVFCWTCSFLPAKNWFIFLKISSLLDVHVHQLAVA